ncbi:MAG: UvrD-helicase domain-containing protein [Endomicrobium sp.]|jgi:ATP-dependent exoDNAse (exonuclease V) beta subunit|nr:UvrD-helicase domain-containing protein [Endomicrobium sp.]
MINNKIAQITSVQASAGSGKTYNLAKRYIRLLFDYGGKNTAGLKNVIAVTFANKAAVEMKYRVIEYLKKAALSADTEGIFDDTGLSADKIRLKSLEVLDEILNNYDNFNIGTIDSFINSILKACAINMDISPNFRIEKDYSENLEFALDSFLQSAGTSKNTEKILLQYISQYLISDKSGWFPKNDIYNEVEKVFKKAGNLGKSIAIGTFAFDVEILKRALQIIKKAELFCELFSEHDIYSSCLRAIEKIILTGKFIFYAPDKIPKPFASPLKYKKNAVVDDKAVALWNEIAKEIAALCVFYANNYYGVYSDIYSRIDNEFEIKAKKDELVFLHDINKKAMTLFKNGSPVMPEVYYRLSEKYKHFLIDEFQDTSPVQWAGIKRFLDESIANGGTFFYVGDAKQAIYDFRGGSWEIFYNALSEFTVNENDITVLSQNYRSHKEIVEFNNEIFSRENIERYLADLQNDEDFIDEYKNLTDVYSQSKQNWHPRKQKGYVEIEIIDKNIDDQQEETKRIFIGMVSQLTQRFNQNDITVLCRSNMEVLLSGQWLLENGFDVESGQTLNIRNNDIIKQLISLIAFIDSPMDSLSFASFITGEIFCKAADTDIPLMREFVFDFHNKRNPEIFYKKFREEHESLWQEYFEKFFVQAGFTPVYELTLSILEKFKVVENFKDSKPFVIRFLDLIKTFEEDDGGLENFLDYFKKLEDGNEILYIKTSSGNGIKIMTIHKAKGLQFPVVIMPFLKLAHTDIDRPLFADKGEKINLIYITKNLSELSTELKNIYNCEKAKTLMSEMNVLYVSMTRAECEFYAIVPPKAATSYNTLPLLIGKQSIKRGTKEKYALKYKHMQTVFDALDTGYKEIKNYFQSQPLSLDINNAKQRGSILHFALSKIKTLKNKNKNVEIETACEFTERKFPYDDTVWIKEKLFNFFKNKEILSLFDIDEKAVFNEFEIVNSSGETYRIDKTIIKENEVIVIDFKSSNAENEENRMQVIKYINCLKEIYAAKNFYGYIIDTECGKVVGVQL